MDPVLNEPVRTLKANRGDLFVFSGAFAIGVLVYLVLRTALYAAGVSPGLIQITVTLAIVGVMAAYAVVVSRIPRLRVRLDQAGDNVYYLGLLFTLTSMAGALWEFGRIVTGSEAAGTQETGARQIIANFGIALASTIAGIFLRVILHQMRVDPADVEGMTRIELAEASKRVRASLDSVSGDMTRFHDEVRQRAADAITSMTEETQSATHDLMENVRESSKQMLDATQKAQTEMLDQTKNLLGILKSTADEAAAAVERLRAVEPPPVLLAKRLGKITSLLETMGEQATALTEKLAETTDGAAHVVSRFKDSAEILEKLGDDLGKSQAKSTTAIEQTVVHVSSVLERIGEQLGREGELLTELRDKSRKSVVDAALAQKGAIDVLKRLNQVTEQLVSVLQNSVVQGSDVAAS